MDSTEKKVLTSVCKGLRDSTKISWESGDIEDWANFAKKMQTSINYSITILEDLIKDDDKNENGIKL